MYYPVDLSFLCEEVAPQFNDYIIDNATILNAFYCKSFDGGPNHEIHKIIVITLDQKNKNTPYTVDYYHKEYMWNNSPFITFEQEPCDLLESKNFKKLKDIKTYLQECYYVQFTLDEV